MRKAIWSLAALMLLAFGCYVGWKVYQKKGAEAAALGTGKGRTAAVAVEIAPVRPATLRDVGLFTGSLVPDSKFVVAPRVAGRLEKLLVNIGDPVRRNQAIAELDDEEYVQQADRARAELEVARANVTECESNRELARREFERVDALAKKKIASDSELEQARAQHQVHQARCRVAGSVVAQREAALKEAEIRLSYTKIFAAWAGGSEVRYVGARFVDQGAMLAANDPICSIIDNSTMTAAIYVIERDYARIAVGQEAKVATDAWPGRTFSGRIVRIAPQLQESSRQGRVEVAVPNPDNLLKAGMFARVSIEFAEHRDVPAVPVEALARRDGQMGVFVTDVRASTAKFVPLELGITGVVAGQTLVEVLSPPLAGPVVVMGQHLLEDGSAVKIDQAEQAAGEPTTREETQ